MNCRILNSALKIGEKICKTINVCIFNLKVQYLGSFGDTIHTIFEKLSKKG